MGVISSMENPQPPLQSSQSSQSSHSHAQLSRLCVVHDCETLTGGPSLCHPHTRAVMFDLARLPRLYVELSQAMAPGAVVNDADRITGSREQPLAINTAARAAQEDMTATVCDAESAYRASQRWAATPPRGREGARLAGAVIFTTAHLDGIVAQPWGGLFGLDVIETVRSARRLLGQTRLVHRLDPPCPTCDTKALERRDGSDRVVCQYCGRWFTEDDYDRLVLILTSGMAKSAKP